jgi:hypothetical protein
LKLLDLALKDSGEQLSPGWVERDPDQKVFGDAEDSEWLRLLGRFEERPELTPLGVKDVTSVERDTVPYPARPWGDPVERARWWLVALAIALGAAAAVARWAPAWYWLIPLGFAAFFFWRLRYATWESRGVYGQDRRLERIIPGREKPEAELSS